MSELVAAVQAKYDALDVESRQKLVDRLVLRVLNNVDVAELVGKIDWSALFQKIIENIPWETLIPILINLLLDQDADPVAPPA